MKMANTSGPLQKVILGAQMSREFLGDSLLTMLRANAVGTAQYQ